MSITSHFLETESCQEHIQDLTLPTLRNDLEYLMPNPLQSTSHTTGGLPQPPPPAQHPFDSTQQDASCSLHYIAEQNAHLENIIRTLAHTQTTNGPHAGSDPNEGFHKRCDAILSTKLFKLDHKNATEWIAEVRKLLTAQGLDFILMDGDRPGITDQMV